MLIAGSLMLSRFWETGAESGTRGSPVPAPRGIVLVCIDTLRADAMSLLSGAVAGAEAPMPRLEAFARDATVFADVTGSSGWTGPSVASLLTGLYPSHHGMLPYFKPSPLAASVETLAERLKAGGWATGAITAGGWVSPDLGFGQGFESFATNFDNVRTATSMEAWDRARQKGRPFFLFVHTNAAHDPYGDRAWLQGGSSRLHTASTLTPAELSDGLVRGDGRLPNDLLPLFGLQFLTDPRGRRLCRQTIGAPRYDALLPDLMPWYEGGYVAAGNRTALESSIRDSYRSGLAGADEAIHEVFAELAWRGLLEGADVIVTGDHGECFGEHGTLWHGLHLYDEALRVPMIVRARGRVRSPHLVHGASDLTDVAPTVLALAGLPPASGLDGRSLLLLAEHADPGRTAVAEMDRSVDTNRPMDAQVRMFVARTTEWKWILRYDPADATILGQALYHLTTDPGETTPLPVEVALPAGVGEEFRRVVEAERARLRALTSPAAAAAGGLSR